MRSSEKIAERIRDLMKEKGVKVTQLSRDLNLGQSTVSGWLNGTKKKFDVEQLEMLANYFNVSIFEFFDNAGNVDTRTVEHDLVSVPIIGEVKAGYNLLADENIIGHNLVPQSQLNGGEYFFLHVTGDSMSGAGISEGDSLMVRKQPAADNGQIVVVLIEESEVAVKRIYFDKNDIVILQSDNPDYPPRTYNYEDIKILGVVKQRTTNVR